MESDRRTRLCRTIPATSDWPCGAPVPKLLLLLMTLAELLSCSRPAMGASRPSFIVIMMDTVRADHLSCYGYEWLTTPHIDSLAERALLFENAFAPAPWTLPSHASLFTGLYPWEHGVEAHAQAIGGDQIPALEGVVPALPEKIPLLAELLKAEGYRTGAIVANSWLLPSLGFSRGFDSYEILDDTGRDCTSSGGRFTVSTAKRLARATHVNARALKWLTANRDGQFFLFLNYMDAHPPLLPISGSEQFYDRGKYGSVEVAGDIYTSGDRDKSLKGELDITEAYRARLSSLYDAELNSLDAAIGELLDFCNADPQLARATVIVTSDHGQNLGEQELLGHGLTLGDAEIRIPLIIKHGDARERRKAPTSLVDLFSTILDLASVSKGTARNGINLLEEERDFAFSSCRLLPVYRRAIRSPLNRDTFAVCTARHKLVLDSVGSCALYQYPEHELGRTIEWPASGAAVSGLESVLMSSLRQVLGAAAAAAQPEIDPEVLRRLEALGYIERDQ